MEDLHEFADTIDPPVYLTSIVMTLLCMTPRDREVDLIYINYRWCVCPQHALTIIKGGMHYILAQQILEFLENTGFYIRVSKDVFDSHATMIDQSVSQNQSKINLIKPESLLVTLSFLVNCFKASGLVEKTIVRNHHTQDEIPYIQELLKFNSDFSNILSEPRTV